jgi:hypothetical protein
LRARRVPTGSLGTLMEREIWILKKVVGCVLFKTRMVTSGRGLVETYKSIMLHLTD